MKNFVLNIIYYIQRILYIYDKPIYLITTFEGNIIDNIPDINKMRTVGYFYKLNDAIEGIKNNYGDIYECGHYPFIVLETVCPNCIYPISLNNIWFKWDISTDKYTEIDEPIHLKNICNFGIG